MRNLGDGPHYYQWQRDFLYAEEDRRVMLVMNMENHLTDEELFRLMREKWEIILKDKGHDFKRDAPYLWLEKLSEFIKCKSAFLH